MAVLAREVVHIKCIPIDVKLSPQEECYAELAVSRQNKTYFLTPKTHILKAHGTRIACNKVLPTYYYLEREWYKFNPKPEEARKPIVLKPLSNPTWQYINPADLATSGIYTPKDLDELRDRIMFPVEKVSLLNDVAREIHGQTFENSDDTLSRLINDNAVDKIVTNAWSKFWGRFVTFGSASAGVIAIIVMIQGVKMIIEILINGYALHQIYGWSVHLLAAIWNSAAYFLINLNRIPEDENHTTQNKAELENLTVHFDARKASAPEEEDEAIKIYPTVPKIQAENKGGFFNVNP